MPWEGNWKSGVALAMRHGLCGFDHLLAESCLSQGDTQPLLGSGRTVTSFAFNICSHFCSMSLFFCVLCQLLFPFFVFCLLFSLKMLGFSMFWCSLTVDLVTFLVPSVLVISDTLLLTYSFA